MTECPECAGVVKPKEMIEGEIFTCPECGVELEVTGVSPFAVALAPTEQEDWGE